MTQPADFDPSPPDGLPLLAWGGALPMMWEARADGTIFIVPKAPFLTAHGEGRVAWRMGDPFGVESFEAYHVRFPDRTRGVVRCQRSAMGFFNMNDRPWRRRRDNSWWPGRLDIFRDRLEWSDSEHLLDLWRPDERWLKRALLAEFGPEAVLRADQFHWPDLYVALCDQPDFLAAVRDNDFGSSVHDFLRNHNIARRDDGRRMLSGSDRRYGDMLGAWRRCGESYLDFMDDLPGQPDRDHWPVIAGMLLTAGFAARER